MTDETNLDQIEEVKAPESIDEVPALPTEEEVSETLSDAQEDDAAEEEKEQSSEEETVKAEESDGELPLPGDKAADTKKAIPKWVEKKLSRKEMELQQKEAELAQARALLEQRQIPVQQVAGDAQAPKRENFANDSDFFDALIDHKQKRAQEKSQVEIQQRVIAEADQKFRNKWLKAQEEGSEKYEDFEDKVAPLNSHGFPTNRAMAEAIADSPYAADVMMFLGSNLETAKQWALENPVQSVKKIAALEARFEARKKNNVSKAPAPINGVKTNSVKGANINNLMDLDKAARSGSQSGFEKAYQKLVQSDQGEAW